MPRRTQRPGPLLTEAAKGALHVALNTPVKRKLGEYLALATLPADCENLINAVLTTHRQQVRIMNSQDQTHRTTPSTVESALDRLKKTVTHFQHSPNERTGRRLERALKPFLDQKLGVDAETYDLLKRPCRELSQKLASKCVTDFENSRIDAVDKISAHIEARISALATHERLHGAEREILRGTIPVLKLIYEKYADSRRRSAIRPMRKFIREILDFSGINYPDPNKHPRAFNDLINAVPPLVTEDD